MTHHIHLINGSSKSRLSVKETQTHIHLSNGCPDQLLTDEHPGPDSY